MTVAILAVAITSYGCPPLATALLYDRGAILGGEIWRLITGPLVHFSRDHLFYNALVFAAAGFLIERRHTLLFAHLCLVAFLAGGFCLVLLSPGISVFAGLSG
ncbi:MAG: rhomboid family intramembrane serine protease, partial [Syntrophaceae bacterium]